MLNMVNEGVSIITSTIRPEHLHHIFRNYARQTWNKKELIIIVNKNNISLEPYKQKALQYQNVRIYRVDQAKNLGACLNYAASTAKYNYIAKFDDDDYYSPYYLAEAMQLFGNSKADVIGKRSCYFFFPHRSKLLLRKTSVPPYKPCRKIAGATIMFHKRVFQKVHFSRHVRQGTDVRFVRACLNKGFRIYTTSPYNFVAYRRPNNLSHTWKITDKQLLTDKNASIIDTTDFKPYINKSLNRLPIPGSHKSLPASQS
ncbi:glycosyltransferase [Bacillus sp. FJAT-26390]|uniref:glycosyltransferase n=1 Tax=Bacillus sp. FJAT-26390 TaxID=1743142 RepID=UPI000807A9B6|nr:glycosyltransferase [Bacillus sp. FJAT-26390]OBZ13367.1 glycosyl transferase family 2 [Bacillus sp. FJAT-26390]